MDLEKLPGVDVTVERDVQAVMRDGTVLKADVYRPDKEGRFPVLLSRSPYNKRINVASFGNAHPVWYSRHGYMMVVQDCRGRYSSERGIFIHPSTR